MALIIALLVYPRPSGPGGSDGPGDPGTLRTPEGQAHTGPQRGVELLVNGSPLSSWFGAGPPVGWSAHWARAESAGRTIVEFSQQVALPERAGAAQLTLSANFAEAGVWPLGADRVSQASAVVVAEFEGGARLQLGGPGFQQRTIILPPTSRTIRMGLWLTGGPTRATERVPGPLLGAVEPVRALSLKVDGLAEPGLDRVPGQAAFTGTAAR